MRRTIRLSLATLLGVAATAFLAVAAAQAYVEPTGYLPEPGDLVKLVDDGDPLTTADEAVYYVDNDMFRHPFPNQRIYLSWYEDFSDVQEITAEEMAALRLAGNITYRPGTRLIKIPSIPKVYAVEPGGVLRWVTSEWVAESLYGADWNRRIDDVSETFFLDYREGVPLTLPYWPTGTVVRQAADTGLYMIDGLNRRHIAPELKETLRIKDEFVIEETGQSLLEGGGLAPYTNIGELVEAEWKYVDTAELDHVETLSSPQIDAAAVPGEAVPGQEVALAALRFSSGMPLIVRDIKVTLSGNLWSGDTPNLTDIKFVDGFGDILFGTQQLTETGAMSEDLTFSGAYTLEEESVRIIELRGTISPELPAGSVIDAWIRPNGFTVADGGNGDELANYFVWMMPQESTTVR